MNKEINEDEIIECFGSTENYEDIAMQVAQELKKEIKDKGLEKNFEGIDIIKEFCYPYLQNWMKDNKDTISKVLKMKNKSFSEKEIQEYIQQHAQEQIELDIKFKELFGEEKLSTKEQEKKEKLENKPEELTTEEAIKKLTDENEEQIQAYRKIYSEEKFSSKLERDIDEGFISVYSNPKDFQIPFSKFVSSKILKGNTEFTVSTNEKEDFDFFINQEQIAIINDLGIQIIEVYVPDKEYPEKMTRSTFIQREKEEECEKELKELYQKFQQQGVDVSAISERILGLENERKEEQTK